ncbi:MAG TPA: hypothetical protein VLV86_25365 [Vicinamibacterales bacterium]|nr:hypothetical protein [Vicinamibacterales bacterium]
MVSVSAGLAKLLQGLMNEASLDTIKDLSALPNTNYFGGPR